MNIVTGIKKIKGSTAFQWRSIVFYLIFFALISILSVVPPYLIGYAIDLLNEAKDFERFLLLIFVIILFYIIEYAGTLFASYRLIKINFQFICALRNHLMAHVLDLPMHYLSTKEKGYVMSRMEECSELETIFSLNTIQGFCQLLIAVFALILIFILNIKLAATVLLLLPFICVISIKSQRKIASMVEKRFESAGRLNAESFSVLNGIEEYKLQGMKKQGAERFKRAACDDALNKTELNKGLSKYEKIVELVCDLGALLVLLVAGFFIIGGEFTLGLYTTFALYLSIVIGGVISAENLHIAFRPVQKSVERICEILDEQTESEGTAAFSEKIEEICFQKVSFRYDEKPVLRDLSMTFRSGDRTRLKGENGSGKTTAVKLLLGLYAPTEGEILINGIKERELNPDDVRSHISVVSGEPFLFKGTVLENILCGREGKTSEEVLSFLREVGLEAYFQRMPNHIQTEIPQDNTGLSTGQTRIIALVRALLSGKEVVILDEPFSGLDAEARRVVERLLLSWKYSDILIVISHDDIDSRIFHKEITLTKPRG